jgi:hypothetical protein
MNDTPRARLLAFRADVLAALAFRADVLAALAEIKARVPMSDQKGRRRRANMCAQYTTALPNRILKF